MKNNDRIRRNLGLPTKEEMSFWLPMAIYILFAIGAVILMVALC